MIAAAVIPPVKADPFPGANPKSAATAFWVVVALNVLAGTAALVYAVRRSTSGSSSRVALALISILTLLIALVLTDAAVAFYGHGVAMRLADIFLFICVAANLGAGLLMGTAAVLYS